MTRLAEAWKRTSEFKDATAGTGHIQSVPEGAMLGERWITALFEKYGLTEADMDEAGRIVLKVGTDTFANLSRVGKELPPEMLVAVVFASGFSNGLALGLELSNNQTGGES